MEILKCWNGIYGCNSFIIENWIENFKNIEEAKKYYKEIWPCVWIENKQ